ncbi:uncharacterized protein LOC144115864 isoform X2 [Amblyomma americanum]|uniref:Acyl-coa synthetase n=1 Tax=Amblyomma americanum TaxID=6943 RepID=A0AAQ4E225_AMBAM
MRAQIEDGVVYSPYPDPERLNCSFYEAVKKAAFKNPGKLALVDDSTALSMSEFHARLKLYAAGFQRRGVLPGDRVCVHIGNSVENFVAMWGCVVAGATIVLAKPSLTARELRYQITDSDSTHLLVEPALAEKAAKASANLPLKGRFTVGSFAADGFVPMGPLADLDEAAFREVSVAKPSKSVLAVLYTSGTTGLPKGVELTHCAFLANVGMSRWSFPWDESDVLLLPTPITHGSGLVFITVSLFRGTTSVIVPPSQKLSEVVKVVDKHQVTAAVLLPWHLHTLVDEMRHTGQRLRGVVDMATGMRLGPNQTGEIRFRAPMVMKGYYKRPKETADFFDEEGWCKSGDAGYYDEDGRIHFVQRFKEMIKCMDNQVVPAELEDIILREHNRDVFDVCVVGLVNPKYGEAPAAAVVVRNQLSQQELASLSTRIKATISKNCAAHKQLYGGVFFVDSIPKTESGKNNRTALLQKCAN